jgi:hypothetical protein
MAKFFNKQPPIRLPLQRQRMRMMYSQFECRGTHRSLTFIGILQPTPPSEKYEIEIGYKLNQSPRVFVLQPELRPRSENEPVPHTYEEDCLCLYLPWGGEWTPQKFIADTIIPWTSLWLYYYELWHAAGEWRGGGVHPR